MSPKNQGLQICNLSFAYQGNVLFSNWSAALPLGLTWIQGDEGSGKSTLLRLLSGALAAQAGDLALHGRCLQAEAETYKSQVFLIDPQSNDFDQITPYEYFISLRAKYPAFNQSLLEGLQVELDLTPHLDKKMFMLSNGSTRKVWLSAAFACGAALTLIDNPFAALDRSSIKVIGDLLEDAAEHPTRGFVVADYEIPEGLSPKKIINLSPRPASH
jgi:ABC-type transport system involved in cytochrome c biogenesis ATPase subunit